MSTIKAPEWGGHPEWDEHWDPDDPDTIIGECERCGERRPLQKVVDPFVVEGISEGPEGEEWWCHPCWEERSGDV